uniref:Mos1 transposase HTH domain-containing protein n=1 Tax=Acrobeloides nanus TaxID=290746 RepID=A0A914DA45_9BILA
MEKNRGVIRELLKYEFELGHTAKEAMDNINRAKGHGIVAKRTAYEWFSKFKNNQMEIADKKRAGRPREIDRAAVVNTVEAHPSTTRMLAEDFDYAQSQIVEILHAAGKKWLRSRWVPKELTEAQKRNAPERQTRQKVEDLGWEPLDHAPYSPDMAPSDFYLFRSLEHWLRGKKFKTIEEMRESLEEFFASKDRDWYRRGLTRLEEQWQKVIENNGEYFDY